MPIMTKQLNCCADAITFSPDGKHIVVGSWSSAVVLDASTGREEYTLSLKDPQDVKQVQFSPDGTRLVAVSSRNYKDYLIVHIWDVSMFQLLHKFEAYIAAASIEGTEILTISKADSDGHRQFQVLDILAGTLLRTGQIMMAESINQYPSLKGFSSISRRCLIVLNESVEIWDISSERAVRKVPLDDCIASRTWGTRGALSYGGKLVAMVTVLENGSKAGGVVFDASTGSRLLVLPHDGWELRGLHFSYDGTHVVSCLQNGTLHISDAATGATLKVLKINSSIYESSVAFAKDGSHVGIGLGTTVQVWSLNNSAEVECVTQNDSLSESTLTGLDYIAVSDNCQRTMSFKRTKVQVWDATTRTALRTMSVPLDIYEAQMSGNGENIVCRLQDGSIMVLNATTCDKILHLDSKVRTRGKSIAISRSGKKFALTKHTDSGEGRVEIWGLDTGKEVEFVVGESYHQHLLDFSDDERYIVSALFGVPIIICDLQTGNTQRIEREENEIDCLFSFSGNEFAVCKHPTWSLVEGTYSLLIQCEVWDISSDKRQNKFKLSPWPRNHDGKEEFRIYSFGFSSKGKKFVAACNDGYIRVWSAVSNKTVVDVMLVYCSPRLSSIALSRDDGLPVTASIDGSVQVWDLDDDPDAAGKYPWAITKSGWITSSQNTSHRLMWVSERLKVKEPRNIAIISGPALQHGTVDFSGAMLGKDWEKCYSA